MGDKQRLFLIDAPSYYFRAFYAMGGNLLTTSEGLPTNAVFIYTNMIRRILTTYEPEYLVAAFDSKEPTFRHEIFAEYKATRKPMPEELAVQLPYIRRVMEVFGIPIIEEPGWEADDIIATLAEKAKTAGIQPIIVSSDKDLLQLVDDEVRILNTRDAEDVLYDASKVEEKFGVSPELLCDLLALMGDASDNIPGVPGIGKVWAARLLNEYGDLETLLEKAESDERKLAQKISENKEQIDLSRQLVTIDREVPIEVDIENFAVRPPESASATELFRELEFQSLLQEHLEEGGSRERSYELIFDEERLKALVRACKEAGQFALDLETDSRNPMQANILGIGLSPASHEGAYIPIAHLGPGTKEQLDRQQVFALLQPIIQNETILKIGQNLKYDLLILRRYDFTIQGPFFDTMIASYLLEPLAPTHNLDDLAARHLNWKTISYNELTEGGPLAEVDLERVREYACEDTDVSFQLKELFAPRLEAEGLLPLFEQIECALIPVLVEMERHGVKVDAELLESMSSQIEQQLKRLAKKIYTLAGEEFNLNSSQQLAEILFKKLKIPVLRKTTKTKQPSTGVEVLHELGNQGFEIARRMLEYRELSKLKSTYLDALPRLIHSETGRIHTSFNQTIAATGRLSSSEPNLQNIPIRTPSGREIRKAFIPEEGTVMMSADYSQMELRIMAHCSDDELMIDAFERGEDIHQRTAAEVFDVMLPMVDDEMRDRAKTINFGIIYGMGAHTLARELGISRQEAEAFMESYFAKYNGVKTFIDRTLEEVRDTKEVRTLFGRKRIFPDINSRNYQARSYAERSAINTIIQGTGADIIKRAMIQLHAKLGRESPATRMLIQVHDELVFEVPEREWQEGKELIRETMESAYELRVPLAVSVKAGINWLETK